MFLFENNFVLKLSKTKFLSRNPKSWAVLRRIPSVVDVKAKIKPITYVFVRKKIRFKTLHNKVFILQSERLCCITSNTISGWRFSKNQTDNLCFCSKKISFLILTKQSIYLATWKVVLYYVEYHQLLTVSKNQTDNLCFCSKKISF